MSTAESLQSTIWKPEDECRSREDIQAIQLNRLQAVVEQVYENVPFYRQTFDKLGLRPEQIRSLDDLRRIPMTVKEDMRSNYPLGLLAVPREQVVRFHGSSGTTGKPTFVAYTKKDLEVWAELVGRFCFAAGVRPKDTVQIAFGYGLFTGGFGLHYGMERLGASVIPVSSGNTQRQIMLMHDMETTALVCTPSYALHLAEAIDESDYDRADLKLRIGLFGGEFWTHAIREQIEDRLKISATDNYGLSEVIGPGVSGECSEKNGLHIFEDYFIAEVIDPETCEPLPPGEPGELVLTSLAREAMPILRYRTKDICRIDPEPCPCGRTFYRMSKVTGRCDDMLIIRGANIFPSQIEEVLMGVKGTAPHYQLVVRKKGYLDDLEIKVEIGEEMLFDEMKQMQALREEIARRVRDILGISARITLVEPKSIERSIGKAKRVLDLRHL